MDLMAEEPDAEAEPVVSGGSRMNACGALAASLDGGGGLQHEEPAHDDLSWLRGVSEAPEHDPFDRPSGEMDNATRKRRRS